MYSAEQACELAVDVQDFTGIKIPQAHVELVAGATNLSDRFTDGTGKVPFGHYTLRVSALGFKQYEQALALFQPRISMRVSLEPSQVHGREALSGRVLSTGRSCDELWIKLVPLLNTGLLMENRVTPDCTFEFAGMHTGEYLLIVMGGMPEENPYPIVLHTKQLSTSTRQITVKLDEVAK
jgi:hypothetical protein